MDFSLEKHFSKNMGFSFWKNIIPKLIGLQHLKIVFTKFLEFLIESVRSQIAAQTQKK